MTVVYTEISRVLAVSPVLHTGLPPPEGWGRNTSCEEVARLLALTERRERQEKN